MKPSLKVIQVVTSIRYKRDERVQGSWRFGEFERVICFWDRTELSVSCLAQQLVTKKKVYNLNQLSGIIKLGVKLYFRDIGLDSWLIMKIMKSCFSYCSCFYLIFFISGFKSCWWLYRCNRLLLQSDMGEQSYRGGTRTSLPCFILGDIWEGSTRVDDRWAYV